MTISKPDYSNLQNAISLDNQIRQRDTARDAARERASIQGYVNGTMTLLKGGMQVAQQVIETQDNAQKARLQPELEAKSAYYNQLLSESIKNGTTTIERDTNGNVLKVNYAPEVLEYRNTWLDDVNGRDGVSNRVKKWASDTMEGLYNTSDEVALLAIAQNDASLASSRMDENIRSAAYAAANSGDVSILKDAIAGLDVSDQYKEAYMQWAMPIYESESQTLTANNLATTEGIEAAYKYINSLTVDSATKDTLKNGAYNEWQRSNQALTQSVRQDMEAMLEAGKSWTEIRDTLKGREGYTAYQRSLVEDLVTERQTKLVTGICSPFVAQVQSGDMTVDELEDMRKTLQLNKGMFSGIEATYESYNSIISDAITSRKKYDDNLHKEELAEFKNLAQNYYDQWNNKEISGDEALSQIRAIAEANPENLDVVNAMNGFVKKIIDEKVPLAYRDYFNMKMGKFDSVYTNYNKNTLGGYQPMTDAQVSNYTQLYKDTVNYIQSHDNLTLEDIDKFMSDEMDGFFARYADAKALEESQLPEPEPVPMEYDTKDLTNTLDTGYNNWKAGSWSTEYTTSVVQGVLDVAPSDSEVAKKASSILADIAGQKVPNRWNIPYKFQTDQFDKLYLRTKGIESIDNMDDEQYYQYLKDKPYFENTLADYISKYSTEISEEDIGREAEKIMATFRQPYATENMAMKEGVDSIGTKYESFMQTLDSFKATEPFRYINVNGRYRMEWVNDTAKTNWEYVGAYGRDTLQKLGFDVQTVEVKQVGNNASPEMWFVSADGKEKYTINLDEPSGPNDPKRGDVMKVTVNNTPGERSTTYTNTGMNILEEQRRTESEAKAAGEAAKTAEFAEKYNVPTITAEEARYIAPIKALGYDDKTARDLAPKLKNEIDRLKDKVSQDKLFETALKNLGIKRQ